MIRDDKQRVIGKLISINSEKFTVELLNQSINFTVTGFEDIYQYAQINGYVILPYQDFYIVAEIFGVREKDADIRWKGEKEQILSKSNSVKYLDINPIGTIQGKKFKYGISVFPTLYTDVLYIKKEELDAVFDLNEEFIDDEFSENTKLKLLDIGTSTIFPDYKVKIDINGFFGGHSSVLGNTGSGKSCTIASMLQTLFSKEYFSAVGASFVFFDVNGEYLKAFSQIDNSDIEVKYFSINGVKRKEDFNFENVELNDNIEYLDFKLPHWFLNIDEWALLLQASERTQLPILRNALGILSLEDDTHFNHIVSKLLHHIIQNENAGARGSKSMSVINNYSKAPFDKKILSKHSFHAQFGTFQGANAAIAEQNQNNFFNELERFFIKEFNIPSYSSKLFDFTKLEEAIDMAIMYEESFGNKQIRDYCSTLLTRYKSLRDRGEYDFLTQNKTDLKIDEFIDEILGLKHDIKKTQITIIDLNAVEDEVVEVISSVVSRLIFERLKKLKYRGQFPVNLVLEEAHRYISEKKSTSFGEANKIFERIAKEGRKYGMFLMVSSQRPSELSKTVLSQCSNFIVHRIQNPDDLAHIRQMTPHISSNIMTRLPSIPRQHALVFGHSVQIPTLFKVNDAKPTPHSNDSDIVKHWFITKQEIEEDDLLEDLIG